MHLEQRLQSLLERFHVPGLSFALIERAEQVACVGVGVQSAARGTPVSTETVFEAASISKPVVAWAALKLCRAGRLELNAPVEAEAADPWLRRITVRQVLAHTSGLPNWLPEGETSTVHFEPGSRFSYSGVGYRLLQRKIEQVTGQPLAEHLKSSIFHPLGMVNSGFVWRADFEEMCATGHDANGQPVPKSHPTEAHAAYSLHSTAPDLARFMIAVMQSDDPLGMFDPQTPINDSWPWQPDWPRAAVQTSKNVFWGLGWGLEHAPNGWYFWQWGDNTHFKAFVMGSRATGSGFVALTNSIHGDRLWPHLIHEFLGDEHPVISCLGRF